MIRLKNLGNYSIRDDGAVWSHISHKFLVPSMRGKYMKHGLVDDECKTRHISVHRLVAETFIPNPENKPQVNHIDGNKLNNHVSNLEWATAKENTQHSYSKGLQVIPNGDRSPHTKITEAQLAEAQSMFEQGRSVSSIAREFSVSSACIQTRLFGKPGKRDKSTPTIRAEQAKENTEIALFYLNGGSPKDVPFRRDTAYNLHKTMRLILNG